MNDPASLNFIFGRFQFTCRRRPKIDQRFVFPSKNRYYMNFGCCSLHFSLQELYFLTEEEALKRGAGLLCLDLLLTDRKTRIHGGKPKMEFWKHLSFWEAKKNLFLENVLSCSPSTFLVEQQNTCRTAIWLVSVLCEAWKCGDAKSLSGLLQKMDLQLNVMVRKRIIS